MVRKDWLNLNGLWDYSIQPTNAAKAQNFAAEGKILVPFPIESALSGVMKTVGESNRLWYRRTFELPASWKGKRALLHFGAVDWEAQVWVNEKSVGTHRGGYDAFAFDITDALKPSGEQEVVVAVFDPTDAGTQPRGKQVRRPHSIWYTSVTGIWQTPWIEPVSNSFIETLKITPDVDRGTLEIQVGGRGAESVKVQFTALDGDKSVTEGEEKATGQNGTFTSTHTLRVANARLWSPDDPFLYGLKVRLVSNEKEGTVLDDIESYFGMRKIALAKDAEGILRIHLNNKPHFQYGPLDQGWWPDGLYTAATDEALRYDIEVTKKLGMNMARKHVKVEPDRWYYWCDKLGLIVWQDMPSGDRYIGPNDPDIQRSPESASEFEAELERLIDGRRNHPSIVMWVPFNEGWGQYDTARIVDLVRKFDPTRLVDNTSGWSDRGVGDVMDMHKYPGPGAPLPETHRASVLGEFGGLGLPVRGHTWQDEKNWGYRSFTNAQTLTEAYLKLVKNLHPLIGKPGLSAAVYTQTSDVEIEVNGLMTYDRAQIKMDAERVGAANRKLYTPPPPPPTVRAISPTSQSAPQDWRFTTEQPAADWFKSQFDDSGWRQSEGGFGTEGTPGALVRTKWDSKDIWLRRRFDYPAGSQLHNPQLLMHHDEDAEVYLNGKLILKVPGWTGEYGEFPLDQEGRSALKPGQNVLAVHCKQTSGGQYIDVGLVDVIERE